MKTAARLLLSSLILVLAVGSVLRAQAAWSDAYDEPGLGLLGRALAVGTFRGQLVAGTYKPILTDGQTLNYIGRFDGERWLPVGLGVGGRVRAVLEWKGSLYVGGLFGTAGAKVAASVARWDGRQWHAVGQGIQGEVWALAVFGGQLHAGGTFRTAGGRTAERIARFDGTRWQPVGGGVTGSLAGTGVRALLASGGKLFVGGLFARAGSGTATNIAAWDGRRWTALGAGMDPRGSVCSLTVFGSKIVAGGGFFQAGTVRANHVAAWDGRSWSTVGPGLPGLPYALTTFNGSLFAGGTFGPGLHGFARWNGSRWVGSGGVTRGARIGPTGIRSMTLWDGKLAVGGEFSEAGTSFRSGPAVVANNVATFDGSTWAQVGTGLGFNSDLAGIVPYAGGIVAFGRFNHAGSARAFTTLVVFSKDGGDWQKLGEFSGAVNAAVQFGRDLVVGGNFSTVNGKRVGSIARFNGSTWSSLGNNRSFFGPSALAVYKGQLYQAGTGSPKRWNGSTWQTFGPPIFGSFVAMHVHRGVLYIGGSSSGKNIYSFDGTTLAVVGGGTDGSVESLGSFGTDLIAGGRFSKAGGVSAQRLARWDGRRWQQLGPGIRGASVRALAVLRGSLYVGGNFSRFTGENADFVARFDGRAFRPLGSGLDSVPLALLPDDRLGQLYAGGKFLRAGGKPSLRFAVWELQPRWTDLGKSLAGTLGGPILAGQGTLLANAATRLVLSSARPASVAALVAGGRRVDLPVLGGTLVPSLDALIVLPTGSLGLASVRFPWPAGMSPGTTTYLQAWILDPSGPQGLAASNGLAARTP